MTRFFINIGFSLLGSALGLVVASWLLDDVRITVPGFVWAVIVFTVAQIVLSPLVVKIARKYASGLLGVIGLVSTLLALIVASIFSGGLSIRGAVTWVLASLIVWAVSSLGVWLLPMLLLRKSDEAATT